MSNSVSPTPMTPAKASVTGIPSTDIKSADPDIILFDSQAESIEYMTDLIFEQIGGQELISISRSDTINGQDVIYQPIRNVSKIQQQYNPNNILSLQSTSDRIFAGYSIKLDNKVPTDGENVYFNPQDGSIIIEAINLEEDELIQIQFIVTGTIYSASTT